MGGCKAEPKTSRGKISFNSAGKGDLVVKPVNHHPYNPFSSTRSSSSDLVVPVNPYNPFSSSSEEEVEGGEAGYEDRRGRVRGRNVAGEQLITRIDHLLLVLSQGRRGGGPSW